MLRVEYNIRAYNISLCMIQLVYIPPVLLVPVIDPAFGITIVYPRSALYLVQLFQKESLDCIQKKIPYSLYSFHPQFCASKINKTTNNNNMFCQTKKMNDPFCASKRIFYSSLSLRRIIWWISQQRGRTIRFMQQILMISHIPGVSWIYVKQNCGSMMYDI